MEIKRVTIHNFGPYFGEHVVDFGSKRPIVIIHGENMRGKTSFLNALRWALYGHAENRLGNRFEFLQLLNLDAASESDWTMSVSIRFTEGELEYDLTRAIQPKKQGVKPLKDKDFEEKLFLQKQNIHLSPDDAQTEINRILPETTSRFFLFDGELLNDYEELVANPEKQASIIKESIEQILGVPAITNAVNDLSINLKDASKRQRKLAKEDDQAKEYAADASRLEAKIEALIKDIEELRIELNQNVGIQSELDQRLLATPGIEADAKRLGELNEHIFKYRETEMRLLQQRRDLLTDAWKDLLELKIEKKLEMLKETRSQQYNALQKISSMSSKIEDIKFAKSRGKCPICDQDTKTMKDGIFQGKLEKLSRERSKFGYEESKLVRTAQSIETLEKFKSAGVRSAISNVETQLINIRISIVDYLGKKEELENRLKDHDYSEVVRNRRDFEAVTKEIGAIEKAIADLSNEIEKNEQEASEIRAKISEVSGPQMQRLNREVKLYEDLISLFKLTIDRLRDTLRKTVEKDATDIFDKLISDKSYIGLKINRNYGLTILDGSGANVEVRSAGAEQVVALSLIGALNRNAVRRGPIIMDTPFGRLDPFHRENVLKFVPTMATQVVLLVHGGEIDRDRDISHILDRIDKEYVISYVSSRRSNIQLLREIKNES